MATLFIQIVIKKFLLRKIKIIYKIIHSSQLLRDGSAESPVSDRNTFENIEDEVAEWAKTTRAEIKSLKSLETYRKNYVGNISHELKTPIFAIQGFLHTLLEGGIYDENINIKYLERATANTDRLKTIVEDLDLISQLEENTELLHFESFDILNLTKKVISELQMHSEERNIKIMIKGPINFSTEVFADQNSLRQVLTNLIINSIKYGKENGTTKIGFYDMEDTILTEISDNGIGISENHLKHLFDRFYRVDHSRSRMMGGSGLGLSIVKHIIEAHKQTINVRSTLNVGSTFGFTLQKKAPKDFL
jgi:two-component system phosphate regulon sensor histidine kinase PhoR